MNALHWTELPDKYGATMTAHSGTWPDLLERIRTVGTFPSKDKCPWIKGAAFGTMRTPVRYENGKQKGGSLRHDGNVEAIFSIEGDYDGEQVTMAQAAELLESYGIRAALYPSPSNTAEKPRWRVIAPLARQHTPAERAGLVARLNGALNGILAKESFTLSQGYFFGATPTNDYRVTVTFDDPDEGNCIDDLDELDEIAIFKTAPEVTQGIGANAPPAHIGVEMFEAAAQPKGRLLGTGDGRRELLKSYIASRSARGVPAGDIRLLIDGIAARYFDPGDPLDEKNIEEIIRHFADKDANKRVDSHAPDVDPETGEIRHPLAKFVTFDMQPKAVRWVIPGFIGHGVVVIAGAHGVGKTTALLPLAMVAAGLHSVNDPLAPTEWRHVVYIVEDIEQAHRILSGIVGFSFLGLDAELVRERLHIVEARRLHPAYVAEVGGIYCEQFTRTVEGVDILPLVVVDTKAAVLELENENDNSEASQAMAVLKQGFAGLPVWLVGHVAKPNIGRAEVSGLSMRGGSAFEADANQVIYLIKEADETRYLVRGKTRFEAKWSELQIDTQCADTTAPNEFGGHEIVTMRWGVPTPPTQSRKEATEQAQEQAKKEDAATLRQEIRDAVETAWQLGNPLNRAGVKAKVQRKASIVVATLENLLSERWLYEVAVPAKVRAHPSRSAFLVNFSTEEHDALELAGVLPEHKLAVPESWKKPTIPPVPDAEAKPIGSAGAKV